MLKTTRSLNEPAFSRNDGSRSTFSRNDNSKLASRRNNGNGEANEFGIGRNGMEYTKKSGKLSKLENLSKSGQSKSK